VGEEVLSVGKHLSVEQYSTHDSCLFHRLSQVVQGLLHYAIRQETHVSSCIHVAADRKAQCISELTRE
jgi:hypothetical protein